jgi:signal transduction histidine kinase
MDKLPSNSAFSSNLRRYNKAQAANDTKSIFLANMSHEMRTAAPPPRPLYGLM